MNILAEVGILWPLAGAGVWEALLVVIAVSVLLALLPAGWLIIKRRRGIRVAGPLWPLLFFLILAGAYALATPPWLTPDEPRHMMYVELVRRGGTDLPARVLSGKALAPADAATVADVHDTVFDAIRRLEVWPPDAQEVIDGGGIPGPVELTHPPTYYRLAATLVAPLGGAPIEARVAVLRAFGILLCGWVVWFAGMSGRLLWPRRPGLAEVPMVVTAAVPTFAALAGTVNSDVLAAFVGAALITVLVALATKHRGQPWRWVFAVIALVGIGVATKRTVLPLVPVVILLFFLLARLTFVRVVAFLLVVQAGAALVLLSLPQRPPAWSGPAEIIGCDNGRIGSRALCGVETGLLQRILKRDVDRIGDKRVTLGLWASSEQIPAQVFIRLGATVAGPVQLSAPGWTFGSVSFDVPPRPRELPLLIQSDVPVRIDGVVLSADEFTAPPTYRDDRAEILDWDGRRVENLLLNGSGEEQMVRSPPWLPENVRRSADGIVDAAYFLRHGDRVADAWPVLSRKLTQTFGIFWGSTGWWQPPRLMPGWVRALLGAVSAVGLLGAVAAVTDFRPMWSRRAGGVIVAAAFLTVIAVVARAIPPTDRELVSGRYLFPAMVALATSIAAGWRRVLPVQDRSLRNAARWFALCTHAAFWATVFVSFR